MHARTWGFFAMLPLIKIQPVRIVKAALGVCALAVSISAGLALAWDEPVRGEGSGGDFSGDPTVGTLPMRAGAVDDVPGPDQIVYLYGDALQVRRALAAAEIGWLPGESASGAFALPDNRVWIEFHGDITLTWADAHALDGIEVGIGAGFEGGGMRCVVQSSAGISMPALLEVGRSIAVSPERLHDAGLLQQPVVFHAMHQIGYRTRVEFEAPAGGFIIRQII